MWHWRGSRSKQAPTHTCGEGPSCQQQNKFWAVRWTTQQPRRSEDPELTKFSWTVSDVIHQGKEEIDKDATMSVHLVKTNKRNPTRIQPGVGRTSLPKSCKLSPLRKREPRATLSVPNLQRTADHVKWCLGGIQGRLDPIFCTMFSRPAIERYQAIWAQLREKRSSWHVSHVEATKNHATGPNVHGHVH